MKLRDTQEIGPDDGHDAIWELIPWYVNGTLPTDQMEAVDLHIQGCKKCAVEVSEQRNLAKKVVSVDPFEAPSSRSWEKLRAQIEAEGQARAPQKDAWRWLRGFQGGLIPVGMAVAASLALVVLLVPADDGFRTLTSDDPTGESAIRFQPAVDLDSDTLAGILGELGLTLVAGPSEAGVYTAVPAQGDEPADLESASKTLMARPEILFATPSERP